MADIATQIVIDAQNRSDPAFQKAVKNMKDLDAAAKSTGREFRTSLQAIGTLAKLGSPELGQAVTQVEVLGLAAGQARQAFSQLGAARVATYGAIGIAAALGVKLVTDEIKKYEQLTAATLAADAMQEDFILNLTRYVDVSNLALQSEQTRFRLAESRIQELQKEGIEVERLVEMNEKLNAVIREQIQTQNANRVNQLFQDVNAENSKLIKSSAFGTDGGRAYETFQPEQGREFLNLQRDYDARLEAFKKFTNDKQEIADYEAELNKARALAEKNLMIRFQKEELAARLALQNQYAEQASQFFENLANTAKAFGKKGFEAWKAFSIAQAIVDTYKAANAAYAALAGIPIVGPALGAAAAGAAIAAGLANVAMIAQTKPAGAFHGGSDYVPREASYLLQAGERVIQPEANRDLTRFLKEGRNVSVTVNLSGREILRYIGEASASGQLTINSRAVV